MNKSTRTFSKIIVALALAIIINFLASVSYKRFDLTSEKRFTLTNTTTETLLSLNDTIRLHIFLGGQIAPPFNKIKNELRDLLYEFNVYAGQYIEYEFIDAFEGKNKKHAQETYENFVKNGLRPVANIQSNADGSRKESYIFPGAYITAQGRTLAVNLYKSVSGQSTEANIHFATQNLEYELINAIQKLLTTQKPTIGFLTDNNTLRGKEIFAIKHALREYYEIKDISIQDVEKLDSIKTLIIAKPSSRFTETDKFLIDQYIMHGGNVMWLIDMMNITMDSLKDKSATIAFANDLNLTDQLFRYGVRINQNLVLDNQCNTVMINVAPAGVQPQFNPVPWYFSPLITANMEHPITKNLNLIASEFISQIDTLNHNPKLKKTVLLQSSSYARVINAPVPVNFNIINQRPDERFFDRYKITLGVLIEGEFESLFRNRVHPKLPNKYDKQFQTSSSPTKMIVIADGDIIRNEIRVRGADTIAQPLGVNKYTNQTFGNADFIVNAINYMNDNSGLLELRSRELTIRLLNKNRVQSEKTFWQIINVVIPIILIILIGIISNIVRKRKYSIKSK